MASNYTNPRINAFSAVHVFSTQDCSGGFFLCRETFLFNAQLANALFVLSLRIAVFRAYSYMSHLGLFDFDNIDVHRETMTFYFV